MKRFGLAVLILFALVLTSGSVQAALPTGGDVVGGDADIATPTSDLLTVNQTTDRAVIHWDTFHIGQGAEVRFVQPGAAAAILNIVNGTTATTLAGQLTADGSVFLINPYGITITEHGVVDTRGAFVAATLQAVDASKFMDGDGPLEFLAEEDGPEGRVTNEGTIWARDVVLLGSRVANTGTITAGDALTARIGRVAFGSASHATLDLTGDGFLQVLAPADVTGDAALVTNSGDITADGGLVQLQAATVYEAMREAVRMDGTVRARSVEGREGAIVFSGGEGGTVTVSGTVDASSDPEQGGLDGGSVRIEGTIVDLDFERLHVGARGHFSLAADLIEIATEGNHHMVDATRIVEGLESGDIGDLLRAGVNVTLHGNDSIIWQTGLRITDDQLTDEAAGKVGDVHLLAGRAIEVGRLYSTWNSDWRLTVNAKPVSGIDLGDGSAYIQMFTGSGDWAEFDNHGHLTLEILDGEDGAGLAAGGIDLPRSFSGQALTAHIPAGIANYDDAYIRILGSVKAADTVDLSGNLFLAPQQAGVTTVQGQRVTWVTEQTDRLVGSHLLRFMEGDDITRFGRGANVGSGSPYIDSTRLILGSNIPVSRLYGEQDPDASELWDVVFHLAPHNKVLPGHGSQVEGSPLQGIPVGGIPLTELLKPGSIAVEGPGSRGETNRVAGVEYQYLRLVATDEIDFNPVTWEERWVDDGYVPWYLGGAAGGYWIDFSDANELASRVPLVIEPRPITVNMFDRTYTYGDPHEALLELVGVVNDDNVIPTGQLRLIAGGDENEVTDLTYVKVGDGFGLDSLIRRGQYAYTVTGLAGDRAGNYVLTGAGAGDGRLHITPRPLSYWVPGKTVTYGDAVELPGASLTGVLAGDDVKPIVELFRDEDPVENGVRLRAGLYDFRVTGLAGDDADNYEIADGTDGRLRVEPRLVTWSIGDTSSEYGTMATFDITLAGVLEDDDVVGSVALRDVDWALTERTDVGTYYVIVNTLAGADRGNYTLLADWGDMRNRVGKLTINPKLLTWDTTPVTIMYGDTSSGRFFGENPLPKLVGVLSGDNVTLKRTYVQRVKVGESQGPDLTDIGVGQYELRIAVDDDQGDPLEGTHSHNYMLSSELPAISMTVTPRPVRVTAWDTDTVYGIRAFPEYDIEGALGSDQVFGRVTVWAGDDFIEYDERTPVGLYTLRVTELWGEAAANYTIDEASARRGFLQIIPKVLQFSSPVTIVYGDELRFDATTDHGVLAGDSVQVDTQVQSADGKTLFRPGAGTYTGVVTGLSGAHAGNYKLPEEAERVIAKLTISKRPVTVHVLDQIRTYGQHVQSVSIVVDNVAPGDVRPWDFTFGVSRESDGTFVPLSERTSVGTYWLRAIGLDDPNYTLASAGHTDGLLQILPKPVRYITFTQQREYGATDPVFNGWLYAQVLEEDILPGDQVYAGDVVVANRDQLPERLPAGSYRLALDSLGGIHGSNYIIEHVGSTQGLLTITPRTISAQLELLYNGNLLRSSMWNFGDLELEYGFHGVDDDGFVVNAILAGVLEGDDVSLSILAPKLERSSQGYLTVGEYVWSSAGLTGIDGGNYVLDNNALTRKLQVRPRPVRLTIGSGPMMYGDPLIDLGLGFAGDDDKFFAGNRSLDVSNVVIRSTDGIEYTVDELINGDPVRLPARYYFLAKADEEAPIMSGADAKNFDVTLAGGLQVDLRPLIFEPPTATWIYGDRPDWWRLYSNISGPDGRPGILEDDDISVEYWSAGIGISENNKGVRLDPDSIYNPAGEYRGFGFRLTGADAGNYSIARQPDYAVTILPRPLRLPMEVDDPPPWSITYRDELRPVAGPYGGILPADGDLFVGVPDEDGTLRPTHLADAGRYEVGRLGLVGHRADNYVLQTGILSSYFYINPRVVLYSIEDVLGQYGNFLPCLDPTTCNGGPRGPHGDRYLWVPGLELGDVELEGVFPGDDVSAGNILLLDANGRTGRLEDVPPPGVYFQVLEGLSGRDAHNYRIAATGNRPGVLSLHPQWVRWATTDGIYMPETGFRALNPNFEEGFELVEGLQTTITGATGELDLEPEFQFIGLDIEEWQETHIAHPRDVRPGNYYVDVAGFKGPLGFMYQPLPRTMSSRGILSVFADSRLGMESVELMDFDSFPDGEASVGAGTTGGGTGSAVPAGGTGAGGTGASGQAGASDTDSSPAFGDQFGFDINPELFERAALRGDAYVSALAEYGVTGVRLRADAGIAVEYQIGKGYVEVGAEARARADVGPTGISGAARVGAKAGGGVEGSLGGGVDGSASGHAGVVAVAEGKAGLVYENGAFALGSKSRVGAGASVGARGGLSWDGGSVDAGVTVYSPGTIGQNFSFGAGFSSGVLTLNATIGLSLGFGGFELDLGFSIDLSAGQEAFEKFACAIGGSLVDCSPSELELGIGYALAATEISDPLERFAFLYQNDLWLSIGGEIHAGHPVDPDVAQAYFENRIFFEQVTALLQDVERYIAEQESAQVRFFHDLENDPMSALHAARNFHRNNGYFAQQARSINQRMTALGIQLEIKRESFEGLRGPAMETTDERL